MSEFTVEITVQPEDIDILNHMNNIVYIQYLEDARLAWYQEIGLDLEKMMKNNQAVVLRNLDISYIREAHLGDKLTIVTRPAQRGRSSFILNQEIYNQANELITEAESTTVMIDLEKRKSIPLIDPIGNYFDTPVKK